MASKGYHDYPNEPIAIIGSACRFPGDSSSPTKLWQLLQQPRDVLKEIPDSRFNPNGFYHKDGQHHGASNVKHSYLLEDDVSVFDAQFFGVKPIEANSIDPQQRILLETVYEGLETAGLSMDKLQGSQTGVYVGVMSADYTELMARDLNAIPTYFASGTARSILSNRVSYFFNWHGPSMTIDTACSSSLIALHQAVQSLRAGESTLAVVGGSNLLLGPDQYIAESKLQMLSPDGRSRMWDKDANGYARGEGVAALVLKTLSAALADGDFIESIVRETGINQDGRTKGITMPSSSAQADLIRSTYKKAGLDLSKQSDRPQYFEAHGTGTPAGDPIEARAISTAFFGPESGYSPSPSDPPLYVGSIKTVIGHTEGTAGVAGVLKGSLALQNSVIPPNLLLNELSPTVRPFYTHLEIVKQAQAWPALPVGVPRRVSVNSFGFGGANAHAILESYHASEEQISTVPLASEQASLSPTATPSVVLSPFNFSAVSEKALRGSLAAYASYLRANESVDLRHLSWTLNSKRSTLPVRLPIAALDAKSLIVKLDELSVSGAGIVTVNSNASTSGGSGQLRLLGIFTGQGAQWASMGAQLLRSSKIAVEAIQHLQKALDSLPAEHVPTWSLSEELSKDKSSSRVTEAAFSQPLCTAVQIVLVQHLQAAGIRFRAVVGHSSGEIGAAYAAGYLSAEDAIRIAYYRGYVLHLAKGPEGSEQGGMLAVGTTYEDAEGLCELEELAGRICIAASNSPDSLTLSGDLDAIEEAKLIMEDENKFARLLKVDKAYHSHHMLPCAEPYIEALRQCKVRIQPRKDPHEYPVWVSSVFGKDIDEVDTPNLDAEYWSRNMVNKVLFSQAVEYAAGAYGPFDMGVEVGPHPALKGPTLQTIQAVAGHEIPYTGTLRRGANDVEAFAEGLGTLWQTFGDQAVDFKGLERRSRVSNDSVPKLLKDAPTYIWEHDRKYWQESRYSKAFRSNDQFPHQLLGNRAFDGTDNEFRWKNYVSSREIPWLVHHQVEQQIIFPAAGYLCAVVEAIILVYGIDAVQLIDLYDVTIGQALVLEDKSNVETLFSLRVTETSAGSVDAVWAFYSSSTKSTSGMAKNSDGKVRVTLGTQSSNLLPNPHKPNGEFLDVDPERFYGSTTELGFGYTGPFRKLQNIKRRLNEATGYIQTPDAEGEHDTPLYIHPGTLDCAIQTIILAYSSPGDGRIRSIYLPTGIDSIRINPSACAHLKGPPGSKLPFYASVTLGKLSDLSGDVEVHSSDGRATLIQLQGLRTTPLTPLVPSNDVNIFFETSLGADAPSGNTTMWADAERSNDYTLSFSMERVAYYYIRYLDLAIPQIERSSLEQYFQRMYQYFDHTLAWVEKGTHPFVKKDWKNDTREDIDEIIKRFPDSIDLRLIQAVGDNLLSAIRQEINILEPMMKDNLLNDFYKHSLGMDTYLQDVARMAGEVSFRYPHINVLEIGAGTGGVSELILQQLDGAFSSYTYTDISSGFFEKAEDRFAQHRRRMVFKVLDIERDIVKQGYEPHSFDLIVASMVLHATRDLEKTMQNVRQLLRPGGRLILLEVTDQAPVRFSFIFGSLPGWWLGYDDGRKLTPCVSADQWEVLMRKTGFSNIEAISPHNDTFPLPLSVISTQAVDDRITFLRDPLEVTASSLEAASLIIIGGTTPRTVALAAHIEAAVSRHYSRPVHHIHSLNDVSTNDLPFLGSVVSLVDLEDESVFEGITKTRLAGLQAVFKQSKTVVWCTQGALDDSPHRNMFRGLQRTLVKETNHLHIQLLDFATATDVDGDLIAKKILQLEAVEAWDRKGRENNLLWYREPELVIREGKILVPRVRPSPRRNQRYNAGRRLITDEIRSDTGIVSIRQSESVFVVDQLPNRIDHQSEGDRISDRIRVQITHSLLHSIPLPDGSTRYLSIGNKVDGSARVVLLSDTLDSEVQALRNWIVPVSGVGEPSAILLQFHVQLVAERILKTAQPGEEVAVLDPSFALGSALVRLSAAAGVRLTLITSDTTSGEVVTSPWVAVHPRITTQALKRALPRNLSRLVIVGSPPDLISTISSAVPYTCVVWNLHLHASKEPEETTEPSYNSESNANPLRQAAAAVAALPFRGHHEIPSVVLGDLASRSVAKSTQALLVWPQTSKTLVQIQPATTAVKFSRNKTYWMVGLTGGLGLSIVEYMARHNAGYIVISSRNPKLDKDWIESMAALGCTIRVFANDITSRADVKALHKRISETLPPIAGVAQGAMVLRDSLFPDVDEQRLQTVLQPKVEGSIYLDEVFPEDTLDFFIFFSSVSYITGNAGQSIYGAANAFMAGLASQRRARGLAASVINIGVILGTGYVSRELTLQQQEYLRKVGHSWLSEQDAHEIFAEGVLASRPESADSREFETGFCLDNDEKGDLSADPVFSHLVSQGDEIATDSSKGKQNILIKAQLLEATSQEEVFDIIKVGFLLKLQVALQADPNKPMLELSLDELGVDSLVAVDIRSWFPKELGIDMPLLKILNAPSVRDLLVTAQGLLDETKIPLVSGTTKSAAPVRAPITTDFPQPTKAPQAVSEPSSESPTSSQLEFSPGKSSGTSELDESSSSGVDSEGDDKSFLTAQEQPVAQKTVPLSFGQSRFWFLKHYSPDPTAFNITTSINLQGDLKIDALEKAVVALGQRHDALRTSFSIDGETKKPQQTVLQTSRVRLERITITNETEVDDIVQQLKDHIYDIEHGDVLRIQLLQLSTSPRQYWLLLGYHHIILDGIGYVIFISDLEKAYAGTLDAKSPVVLQYPDFTLRQIQEYQSGAWSPELSYWASQFPDLPKPLPILPLPGLSQRPLNSQFGSHTSSFRIDRGLLDKIEQLSRRLKVTPFHVYLATFHVLLYRYSGQVEDICIGVADGNRKDADVLQSLGMFLNILPLRLKRKAQQTFTDTLREVRGIAQEAFANSRVPFDVLLNELNVPREPSHSPLFQAFLNYRQNFQEARSILGCEGKLDIIAAGQTDYDVSVDILDSSSSGGESLVIIAVQQNLYLPEAAEILGKSFSELLRQFVENPATKIIWPTLHSAEDVDSAIKAGRGIELPSQYPTIVHRIDAISEKFGDRIALKDTTGHTLTFKELTKRVNDIAHSLSKENIGKGSVVGVFQTARTDWISSLLAILRIGATYVPLDLKVGPDRLSLIAEDCQPGAVLVDSHTQEQEFIKRLREVTTIINVSGLSLSTINIIANDAQPEDLAIIMYSSGSTGTPKGVLLPHSAISNYVDLAPIGWQVREGEEIFLNQAAYTFDVSLQQTLTALGIGSTVFIAGNDIREDPAELTALIVSENITVTGATPTEYKAWSRHWDPTLLKNSSWRFAFTWGEPILAKQVQDFKILSKPYLKLIDGYGPAETTITSAHAEVSYTQVSVEANFANPVFPLTVTPNGSLYIVDENLKAVPAGVVGEIIIGGAAVANGYLNNDSLTAKRFIVDHYASPLFRSKGWIKAHRTGDRGRLTRDGRLILLGRIEGSTQVKLAGIRIDLQDIEATITRSNPHVREAIVSVRKDPGSETPFIAAFVTLSDKNLLPTEVSTILKELPHSLPLPQYMRPSIAVEIPSLPTNSSGKLDRRAIDTWPLPTLDIVAQTRNGVELTEFETVLRQLWADTLPQGGAVSGSIIGSSDFFYIGGSSLSLISLQGLIKERLSLSVSLYQLFQSSTLSGMAAVLQNLESTVKPITIDWAEEAVLPSGLSSSGINVEPVQNPPRVVVLTGATGFVGREILRQLIDDARISKIHCIAIRKELSALPSFFSHSKVALYPGDLGSPRLGLSEAQAASIFGESTGAGAVIHAGADVSFMKTYQTLKLVNVASTKELIRLGAPRRLPFHFVSSATVARLAGQRSSFGKESIASYPPTGQDAPTTDGYVSAKWVSEVLLENAAAELGLPVWIHRPTSVTGEDANEQDLMSNMMRFAKELNSIPDTGGWTGNFDFVSIQQTAKEIIEDVLRERRDAQENSGVHYTFQSGEVVIRGDEMQGIMERDSAGSVDLLPFGEWVKRAEQAGMNPLLVLYLQRAAKGQLLLPNLEKD